MPWTRFGAENLLSGRTYYHRYDGEQGTVQSLGHARRHFLTHGLGKPDASGGFIAWDLSHREKVEAMHSYVTTGLKKGLKQKESLPHAVHMRAGTYEKVDCIHGPRTRLSNTSKASLTIGAQIGFNFRLLLPLHVFDRRKAMKHE